MPLQLLQSFKSPFLGIFTINPLNHWLGISSSFQMCLMISCNFWDDVSGSGFKSLATMLSTPPALPPLRDMIPSLTSSTLTGSVLMVSISRGGWSMIAMGFSGGSLFRTSSKCSFHLSNFLCYDVVVPVLNCCTAMAFVIADVLGDSIQGLHMSIVKGLLSHAHLVLQPYPLICSNT